MTLKASREIAVWMQDTIVLWPPHNRHDHFCSFVPLWFWELTCLCCGFGPITSHASTQNALCIGLTLQLQGMRSKPQPNVLRQLLYYFHIICKINDSPKSWIHWFFQLESILQRALVFLWDSTTEGSQLTFSLFWVDCNWFLHAFIVLLT